MPHARRPVPTYLSPKLSYFSCWHLLNDSRPLGHQSDRLSPDTPSTSSTSSTTTTTLSSSNSQPFFVCPKFRLGTQNKTQLFCHLLSVFKRALFLPMLCVESGYEHTHKSLTVQLIFFATYTHVSYYFPQISSSYPKRSSSHRAATKPARLRSNR